LTVTCHDLSYLVIALILPDPAFAGSWRCRCDCAVSLGLSNPNAYADRDPDPHPGDSHCDAYRDPYANVITYADLDADSHADVASGFGSAPHPRDS
jgi:hypothetical protein